MKKTFDFEDRKVTLAVERVPRGSEDWEKHVLTVSATHGKEPLLVFIFFRDEDGNETRVPLVEI